MSKQPHHVRTQIRIENTNYEMLKEYSETNNLSLNESMNKLLGDGLMKDIEENESMRDVLIAMTANKLENLPMNDVQTIATLVHKLSLIYNK